MGITDGPLRDWYGQLMFTNEGAAHRRLRSLVQKAFTPRAVDAIRSTAAEMAAESFDALRADGGGDLVAASSTLPLRVICRLIGVPDTDVAAIRRLGRRAERDLRVPHARAGRCGHRRAGEARRVRRRSPRSATRAIPVDDLVSALVVAEVDGERLTHDEVRTMVGQSDRRRPRHDRQPARLHVPDPASPSRPGGAARGPARARAARSGGDDAVRAEHLRHPAHARPRRSRWAAKKLPAGTHVDPVDRGRES